jgi:uncharacterized protein
VVRRRLPETSGEKKGSIPFYLLFAAFLVIAGCSNSPEGHRAETEQHSVPYSNEELFQAVKRGDEGLVASYIKAGIDVNAKEEDGRTALLIAAEKGDPGMVTLLAENGADVNVSDIDGYTALIYVAYKGDIEIAMLLLKHGANVHARDKDGWTALRFARMQGKTQMAELLKKHGAGKQ